MAYPASLGAQRACFHDDGSRLGGGPYRVAPGNGARGDDARQNQPVVPVENGEDLRRGLEVHMVGRRNGTLHGIGQACEAGEDQGLRHTRQGGGGVRIGQGQSEGLIRRKVRREESNRKPGRRQRRGRQGGVI